METPVEIRGAAGTITRMEPEKRERFWRTAVLILCAVSLAVSAAAIYGIKRLEGKPKPHVHVIRQVDRRVVPLPQEPKRK